MQVMDIDAEGLVTLDAGAGDLGGFVGGVVQHLDLEQLARIIETRHGFDEALDDVALVVDGKLYGNLGPARDRRRRAGHILAVLSVLVDQPVTVQPEGGEHHQHGEIRDHDGQVKGVELVEAAEGVQPRVHHLGPIVREQALRG